MLSALRIPVRIKKALISVAIILEILVLFSWNPPRYPGLSWITGSITYLSHPFISWLGLWQGWDMFAPNPRNEDIRVYFIVTMNDGTQRKWTPPEKTVFGFYQRHEAERFRKWANDHLRVDDEKALWPEAAHFIQRQVNEPGNPVEKIEFIREWRPSSHETFLHSDPASAWTHVVFFRMTVPQKKVTQ